jgi:putative transposase
MNGVGIKRRHLGERTWREVLERFESSGLSVSAFCKREGVGPNSFQRWRARLMTTSQSDSQASSATIPSVPPKFIELGSIGQASVGTSRLEIKLDLGGGLSLHLVRG